MRSKVCDINKELNEDGAQLPRNNYNLKYNIIETDSWIARGVLAVIILATI
jgi:hypothetical protein